MLTAWLADHYRSYEEIALKKLLTTYLSALCGAILFAIGSAQAMAAEGQIVIEDLTPSKLRAEIKKIETEFYRVFNSSIEDENLAVVCYKYTPTGSNISEETCEPQFLIDKRGDNVNDARNGYDTLLTPQGLRNALAPEYAALTAAMSEVSIESEYFRELNGILGALREELESR
ncbi:MAG: hypothetical protein COB20_08260 [SAR86 cluster bacterium]|uniref:Uncharacterized protein n=1 Tax=SAR86 cluster bacterium TaxID=2030880 RepID=A0A2A4X404_9GAMM|nr:MAG: hypothetical protein COB20_08260 [SAR86 cluster bacterium]